MRVWTLGSGSRGNAVLLESGGARLLVDAGYPPRTLARRLARTGVAPESITHLLITHEHSDHARGAKACARKWGWTVIATSGTATACPGLLDGAGSVHTFAAGATVQLDSFEIETAATPHDATDSVAVCVTSRSTGARAGIAYDLGHASVRVRALLRDLDLLLLESNHDDAMLRAGPYPAFLQSRIAGPRGHLSNRDAGALAAEIAGRQLRHLVLAHLSEQCNTPALALGGMRAALDRTRFAGTLHASAQDHVCGPFHAAAGARPRVRTVQLSLPFDAVA